MKTKLIIGLLMFALFAFGSSLIPDTADSESTTLSLKADANATTVSPADPIQVIEDIKNATSWQDLLGTETAIYTIIMILGGYLSYWIPGINKIPNTTYRVLTWAILVIAGASVLGFGNVWQGALSYLISTNLYQVILKFIVKTPKPTTA